MKLLLSFLMCLFVLSSRSQAINESEVPLNIRQLNKKKYPTVKDSKWNKKGEVFEVRQSVNKKQCLVCYSKEAHIISTENEVKIVEVPKPMSDFIVTNFKGQTPTNVCKITDEKGSHSFAAEINHMRYIFDDKGGFLKQEMLYD